MNEYTVGEVISLEWGGRRFTIAELERIRQGGGVIDGTGRVLSVFHLADGEGVGPFCQITGVDLARRQITWLEEGAPAADTPHVVEPKS